MDYEEDYSQQIGRSIVASSFRFPGEDIAWDTVPSITDGFWMANAVEIASLEVQVPSLCAGVFAALEGGY